MLTSLRDEFLLRAAGWMTRRELGVPSHTRQRLEQIIEDAEALARREPTALVEMVKLLGRKVQGDLLAGVFTRLDREVDHAGCPSDLFEFMSEPLTEDGRSFMQLAREIQSKRRVRLATDIVLPWPWARDRMGLALMRIGAHPPRHPWTQDPNHQVHVWLPMGIAWVDGGNHSIAAGIASGMGEVTPHAVQDISAAFEYVTCDGVHYRRRHDGRILSPVTSLELAGMFEVGRIMADKSVSAW